MMSAMQLSWPNCFEENILDFSEYDYEAILASQLCAWGNVFMGDQPPSNFFEVMDAMSKITGVFKPDECRRRADMLIAHRKNRENDDNE